MKIIQVCPRFSPHIGGIETHVLEISKRLAKENEVFVYTTDPTGKLPKHEVIDGINVFRFKSFAPNEAYFFSPKLYFALKKESCDILHIHSSSAFPSYLAFHALKNHKKLIFTPHYHPVASTKLRNFMHIFYDRLQSGIFKNANKVICVSDYEIGLVSDRFKIEKEKMVKIPNGIDTEKFRNLPDYKKENEFNILYVGRLEKYKRVQWILHAMKDILEKNPDKKIGLTIVGKGPFENSLVQIVSDLGLKSFVNFKSGLSYGELINEYLKCNVFVMPSEYEAFSITTLEALACNRPVIVSNVGFLSEVARGNGFTINSEEDLAKSLMLVQENGIKVNFDFEKYSWDNISSETLKVYVE